MALIEPYFNVIVNDAEEVMVVFKNKENEPLNPEFYFDGRNAILRRGNKTDIILTNIGESSIKAICKVNSLMIVETASGQLTFKKNKKGAISFREKLLQTYDVAVKLVKVLPELIIENPKLLKKKGVGQHDTGIVKFNFFWWMFDRIVISLCWIVMFTVLGIVLQQFSDRNYYDVKSDNDAGIEMLKKFSIKYTPEYEFNIFWTTIYRTNAGVFELESHIEELDTNKYSTIPEEKSKNLGLNFELTSWEATGWKFLLIGFGILAFLGSFLPFEYFNLMGKTVESM
ncbi:MAG: hypothetical protein K8S87_03580 [Planctomycetes bacterium]|nr:hypothetical protein [Planctomycetota bacterium]